MYPFRSSLLLEIADRRTQEAGGFASGDGA
jgi:hypothetical protein